MKLIGFLQWDISVGSLMIMTPPSPTKAPATVEAQLRTVPPYAVGAAWALISAYHSYKSKQRAFPILLSSLLIVSGYAIAVGTKNPHARYVGPLSAIAVARHLR